jgi:hypothetical protein
MTNNDIVNLMSGNGRSSVDLVLYLVKQRQSPRPFVSFSDCPRIEPLRPTVSATTDEYDQFLTLNCQVRLDVECPNSRAEDGSYTTMSRSFSSTLPLWREYD